MAPVHGRGSSAGDASTPGTLYVVATPLGNLEDVTLRALRVLKEAALIACEDTRRTARLLQAHGIATPTTSYFEHNERWKGERILVALRAGRAVALVSDAGTPGISDPGYRLVREARAEGIPVVPVPGPSAAVAALSVSGLPTDRFLFVGFLPARVSARRKALEALAAARETLVVYESPVRVVAALEDMLAVFGDRDAFLCREATKVHEEYARGTLGSLRALLAARDVVKGEIVLVVGGAPEGAHAPAAGVGSGVDTTSTGTRAAGTTASAATGVATTGGGLDATATVAETFARLTAEGLTRREAVKKTARIHGLPARAVYALVLDLA
jgi:16S rRNA (cytidine1402-2'-O)-methyltransferase